MKADRSCPKCGSAATWFEREGTDILLRCLCGLCSLVYAHREGFEIQRKTPSDEVRLPRTGSKLQYCLRAVARQFPGELTTRDVASEVGEGSAEVASRLMILNNKGLIDRVRQGRGTSGGSTWQLSSLGCRLMNVTRKKQGG